MWSNLKVVSSVIYVLVCLEQVWHNAYYLYFPDLVLEKHYGRTLNLYSNEFLIDYMTDSNIYILSFIFLFVCILYIECFHWGMKGFPLRLFVCFLFFSGVGEMISRDLTTLHRSYFWNRSSLCQWLSWKQ